jgi:anti-sigma28 factor (negative regulator of flagellin synthesis)
MLLCFRQKQKKKDSLARDNPGTADLIGCCAYDDSKQTTVDKTKVNPSQVFRKQKILDIRRQIKEGKYDLDKRLVAALDKVLEEIR